MIHERYQKTANRAPKSSLQQEKGAFLQLTLQISIERFKPIARFNVPDITVLIHSYNRDIADVL